MAKAVLKERVFAPVGKMLGTFTALDLETFDMEYTESDKEQEQPSGQQSGGKKSTVPEPKDDNPLKPENKSSSSGSGDGGSGGSGGGDSKKEDDTEKKVPDEWDVNGSDLDDEEPAEPSSDSTGGSGASADSGDSSPSSGDGEESDEEEDSENAGGSGESGGSRDTGDETFDGDSDEDEIEDLVDAGNSGNSGNGSDDLGDEEDAGSIGGVGDGSEDYPNVDDEDSENGFGSGSDDDSDDLDDLEDDESESGSGDESDDDEFGDSDSSGDGSDGDSESGGESGDESGRSSGGEGSDDSSGSGDGGSGGSGGGDIDYDSDWDSGEDDESGWSQSELEKAIDTVDAGESESSKKRRVEEERREKEKENEKQNTPAMRNDPDEMKAAKDMLGQAIKETRDNDKKSDDSGNRRSRRDDDLSENDVLGAMGAGSLTSMFNPGNIADWKIQLEKILDQALGFDIITNPNLVNKKLEDAPPGREDEIPDIKSIVVLLDCSGSMGATKFIEVIKHMDIMFQVRKMDKVFFHLIGWGTNDVKRVAASYQKVKGRNFKRTIMTYKGDMGSTNIVPAFLVASQKAHKPDAVLILTDADIFDGSKMGVTTEGKIAAEYVKKNRKHIIWVLTSDATPRNVTPFDPTAVAMKRVIKFKR